MRYKSYFVDIVSYLIDNFPFVGSFVYRLGAAIHSLGVALHSGSGFFLILQFGLADKTRSLPQIKKWKDKGLIRPRKVRICLLPEARKRL